MTKLTGKSHEKRRKEPGQQLFRKSEGHSFTNTQYPYMFHFYEALKPSSEPSEVSGSFSFDFNVFFSVL